MTPKVYRGTDPYVFVSYSHKDKERVFEIINDLMLCACNLWCDTGIHSGEDWSGEIAERLFGAECVLFMVTANSIESEYVKDELNFAKAKQKKIYPVYLENVALPLSLELLLGRAQAISCTDDDVEQSRFKLREKIKNNLPNTVFQTLSDPFYAGEVNHFYLENTSTPFPDDAYFAGEEHNSFTINTVDLASGEKTAIYRFAARPAYEMTYSLNNVAVFDDPYFCDKDSAVLFLSLAVSFAARYPTRWPDFDAVLTIAVSRIESSAPRASLIDHKCVGSFDERDRAFIDEVLHEIEQSFYRK